MAKCKYIVASNNRLLTINGKKSVLGLPLIIDKHSIILQPLCCYQLFYLIFTLIAHSLNLPVNRIIPSTAQIECKFQNDIKHKTSIMLLRNLPQFSNKYQIVRESPNDTKHKTSIMKMRNLLQFSNKYQIVH